jgi:hypothetical protein
MQKNIGMLAISGLVGLLAQTVQADFVSGIPTGWTCTGNCSVAGANGDVTISPLGNSQYGYVSSENGVNGVSPFNLGSETDGSKLVSSVFTATAGDNLQFYFNYITSDGSSFTDYAWARLLNASDNTQAALIFTARTQPTGNIIPGQDMPTPDAVVPNAPIIIGTGTAGGPVWSALGTTDSGDCYDVGCGLTGWILSSFQIAASGNYLLEFGVTDWGDSAFSSGLAFDGITLGGKPIDPPANVPVPAAAWLFGSALVGLLKSTRRKRMA